MHLVSFQIKECFGFRDSGLVDLQDPTNLIYILGRNSSGKTSFLTALAHFSPNVKPQQHPNFANFDTSSQAPYLLGNYVIEENDFDTRAFTKAFQVKMNELNQGNPALNSNDGFKQLTDELAVSFSSTYADELVENARRRGSLSVRRTAEGNYQFSHDNNFRGYLNRPKLDISEVVTNIAAKGSLQLNPNGENKQLLINGSWQPFFLPTAEEIENLLARQLPKISWFSREYSLLDALPDIIKSVHVTQSPNNLTKAFITYLDTSLVKRYLTVENPRERKALLGVLQKKIDILVDEMNRGRINGTELLTIDLDHFEGLQITIVTGGKTSYYRHLSDNTKLLFAYHLYKGVSNLRDNILLFDEPNNGFHATAQEQLLDFLRSLGAIGNLTIVSTHSEHLIDLDHLTGIRLMQADNQGYLSVRNKWYASTQGSGDFQALRPILDAIGLRYGANHLTIRDKVIVTEGVTELLYLRAFRQLLNDERDLHIAPATGDDTILHVVGLLISQGLNFKIVVDTAKNKNIKDKLQEKFGILDTSIYEIAMPTEFTQARGSGIEDIFSKADFAKLLLNTGNSPQIDFSTLSNSEYMKKYQKDIPKRIVAHEFKEHITNSKIEDFDEDTTTRIRCLINFCMNDSWLLL